MQGGVMARLMRRLWPRETSECAKRGQELEKERARLRRANKRAAVIADRIWDELSTLETSVKPER